MDSWGIGFGKRKMENGKRENNASWLSTKLEAANCQQFRNSNCVALETVCIQIQIQNLALSQ